MRLGEHSEHELFARAVEPFCGLGVIFGSVPPALKTRVQKAPFSPSGVFAFRIAANRPSRHHRALTRVANCNGQRGAFVGFKRNFLSQHDVANDQVTFRNDAPRAKRPSMGKAHS